MRFTGGPISRSICNVTATAGGGKHYWKCRFALFRLSLAFLRFLRQKSTVLGSFWYLHIAARMYAAIKTNAVVSLFWYRTCMSRTSPQIIPCQQCCSQTSRWWWAPGACRNSSGNVPEPPISLARTGRPDKRAVAVVTNARCMLLRCQWSVFAAISFVSSFARASF